MTTFNQTGTGSGDENRGHFRRLLMIWLPLTLAGMAISIWVLGPILPPGNGSVEAHGQQVDNIVLLTAAVPVMMLVLVYLAYALTVWRDRDPVPAVDGPAIRGHAGIQLWWLVITTSLVLFLAAYGSIRLLDDGSGGGQGPNPIAAPAQASAHHALQVQVIGQQWQFTYRWPGYGGIETTDLELPAHTLVELHVTSLDVVHSFWAYQLGVKADANPGVDNIAYVTTNGPLHFNIHCAELCGVWHGYMFASGRVVPKAQFASWIAKERQQFAPIQKALTPYEKTYFPAPGRRSG